MLTFEVKAGGGVPPGFYRAKFVDVEATEHAEFGAGSRFVFECLEGEHAGQQATRITGTELTPRNAAGKMVAGIMGEPLVPHSRVDLAPFVGREYLLGVETVPSGQGTRITSVLPAWKK